MVRLGTSSRSRYTGLGTEGTRGRHHAATGQSKCFERRPLKGHEGVRCAWRRRMLADNDGLGTGTGVEPGSIRRSAAMVRVRQFGPTNPCAAPSSHIGQGWRCLLIALESPGADLPSAKVRTFTACTRCVNPDEILHRSTPVERGSVLSGLSMVSRELRRN